MTDDGKSSFPTNEEIDEESRRIRRLRILVHLTLESIAAGDLTPEEAAGMIAATRRVALEMFPGKEGAFDLRMRTENLLDQCRAGTLKTENEDRLL